MHLTTRNVNTAFRELVQLFQNGGSFDYIHDNYDKQVCGVIKRQSRNGPVFVIDEPVMITYTHPKERVLFNQARDANPFFHLYEALWMLAGRNDVAPLAYYAANMINYSDDGETLNGAYGHRWRHFQPVKEPGWEDLERDQLDLLVTHLKADPTSRRAVLQMWNVEDDLLKIGPEKMTESTRTDTIPERSSISRDVCCNLSVIFSLRTGLHPNNPRAAIASPQENASDGMRYYLDMTVTNRSNDLIWGCLGANAVHFSFLQEYMAARIGVEVGRYNQFTNNLHVYESNWKPDEWLKDAHIYNYGFHVGAGAEPEYNFPSKQNSFIPLVKDPATFDKELPLFVETYSGENPERRTYTHYTEPFFIDVAEPMMSAFCAHKYKDYDLALEYCSRIKADDWRTAATNWILKRRAKRETKS